MLHTKDDGATASRGTPGYQSFTLPFINRSQHGCLSLLTLILCAIILSGCQTLDEKIRDQAIDRYLLCDYGAALEFANQAISLASNPSAKIDALLIKSRSLEALNRTASAEKVYQQILSLSKTYTNIEEIKSAAADRLEACAPSETS